MTDLLLKLLGASGTDVSRISDVSLAFRGGISEGWFWAIVLLLGGLVWWMFRSTPETVARSRKWLLTALRVLFLALLVLLLMRPVLALTVEGSIRRLLVMLVDDSSSMQIRDPRVDAPDQKRAAIARNLLDPDKGLNQNLDRTAARDFEQKPLGRMEVLKFALKNPRLNLLPRLERDFDLDPFTFGQGLIELPRTTSTETNGTVRKTTIESYPWVDKLTADSPVTALGDALREVLNRKRGQPLAGIFLATDGANNAGAQPRDVAQQLRAEGVPLYIYGVGITSPRDIILSGLFGPEVSFVQDEVQVNVRVRSQGLSGQSGTVKLQLGDVTVAQQEVQFGADGEQVVTLRFTPTVKGEFDLTASVDPRPDETVQDNNSRTQRLKVIDSKIKVLMVEQSPRWQFRYLQAMLMRDRRVELKSYLVEGDPAISRAPDSPWLDRFPPNNEELFKYDLIIFGDVDPRRLPPDSLERLNRWVGELGGSLLFVAGKRYSQTAYRRTVMERVLPIEFDSSLVETGSDPVADKPIKLELTAAGRANPMMRLTDKEEENAAIWKSLPPVYWVARVARPKPAAQVLLVDPDPSRESRFGKMPVIAIQQYGLGQVMYVGTDNTWRWRKNVGDFYNATLWGQMAQRLAIQKLLGGNRRTQLSTDRQNYFTGERVQVFGRLYEGTAYDPVTTPSEKAVFGLRNGSGRRTDVTLRPVPEQPGLYRGEFIAPAAGHYQMFVERDLNTPLDFSVTEPKYELGETAMQEQLLRDLAGSTGGAFFREEDLAKLPDTIAAKTERVKSPLEVELWSSPLYFLLLLLVVTVEWVLRKMSQLK